MAIDSDQVQEKQETAKTNVREATGFQVFWQDGVSSSDKDKRRKIVYVPQTYLNRLSDEEQETTAYAESINSNFVAQSTDLEFSARSVFRTEQFQQKVETVLNNKSFSRFKAFRI
ncbi:MAG: hypothetical protein IKH30_05150 [Clostridia bacterium]|nr:hypothetical protein [Clostridia bacterium]